MLVIIEPNSKATRAVKPTILVFLNSNKITPATIKPTPPLPRYVIILRINVRTSPLLLSSSWASLATPLIHFINKRKSLYSLHIDSSNLQFEAVFLVENKIYDALEVGAALRLKSNTKIAIIDAKAIKTEITRMMIAVGNDTNEYQLS